MVFFSSFFFPGRALLRQLPGLLAGGLFTGMVVGCVIGVLRMTHTLAGGFIADMLARAMLCCSRRSGFLSLFSLPY